MVSARVYRRGSLGGYPVSSLPSEIRNPGSQRINAVRRRRMSPVHSTPGAHSRGDRVRLSRLLSARDAALIVAHGVQEASAILCAFDVGGLTAEYKATLGRGESGGAHGDRISPAGTFQQSRVNSDQDALRDRKANNDRALPRPKRA